MIRVRLAVFGQIGIVDKLDVEVFFAAVLALEEEAVGNHFHDAFIALVEICSGEGG